MDLTWLDPAALDGRAVAGAVAVIEAARLVDSPHELPCSVAAYTADLQHGWDGDPSEVAVSRDAAGRVVAVLGVHLPTRDNLHLGYVSVTVDPRVRRQGIGRALFEAGVEKVRAAGRTLVMTDSFDVPHSLAFIKQLGLDRAMDDVKRRQELPLLDWARLDSEFEAATVVAADYELFRMPTEIPDKLLPAVMEMVTAINDAPTDDLDIEDEVFSPERIRAFEVAQKAHGRRMYQLVARHRETGVLAGHTVIGVESEQPWYGSQFDTSVLAAHRGHRLGLLLKIGMLRWLAEEEPQLRILDTWNAASNDHMIAVNEALGYQVVATGGEFQRYL